MTRRQYIGALVVLAASGLLGGALCTLLVPGQAAWAQEDVPPAEPRLAAVPKEIPVIVDAKRGDIGSTARHYAEALYDDLGAGAVTLNPYMGRDSLEPFIERKTRGAYILCLTSNEGARDFQLQDDLYLRVARKVREWNTHANLGMVVGATKPQYLTSILAVAPNVPLLIPGLGAQGGELEAIVAAAPGVPPHHLLFNVSRSILYAGEGKAFAQQARVAARVYADQIREALAKNAG